ncbi:MAG: PhnD/SsuA/transferrin family substrate-binding protein [Candidatus Thiodiazotropha sp. (ex. Lucinisca nassula)]|nr:PhnD/SsuA/transferrin family substrate-binding protein [Candidatus Thiodiazotropha sp. (ex. Lucinisca nassula)]
MRLFILPALLIALTMLGSPASARELRFAPLPLEDKKIIHEQFQGLASFLSGETGHKLKMVFFHDYARIIDAFGKDEIDLAYLGPLPYVVLKKQFEAQQPVVCFRDTQGEASYTCSLVVFEDSGMTLNNLRDVHIGLTQPYSTCGYLAVSQMLAHADLSIDGDGNRFSYAGSHSKAALGVVRGEYDVAGVKTAISKRYLHMGLKRIAESTHFPGFALIANTNTVKPEEIVSIRRALLTLDPQKTEKDRKRVSRWGKQFRNGAVTPDNCNYNDVADALTRIPWPIPGTE